MPTFAQLLKRSTLDLDELASHLDGLDHDTRVREVRQVGASGQRKLYAALDGRGGLDMDFFVPAHVPPRTIVKHFGKNTLPLFTHFEKPMVRPEEGAGVLWGYNESPVMDLVGPGHFVLKTGPQPGEVHVDYYVVPPERVDGFPELKPNTEGIQQFVYGYTIDVMRRVSRHVSIGRAVRHGSAMPAYFLLCRDAKWDEPEAKAA
jgi:hypothetical protein